QVNRLAVLALFAAVGCGPGGNPNAKPLAELEAATRAFDRAVGLSTAFVTVGNIDTGATPAIIAGAILNRVQSEAAGCVNASSSDATVHADFGAGCALATASMHAGGTVDVAVAPDMTTGGVTITLALAITVDGAPLAGALVLSTANGNSFTYASDGLTVGGTTAAAPLLTAGIAAGGATLDAAQATANGAALVLAAVHERFAACYPDEGTAKLGALGVTFASDTPQTGAITLSTGATATLPLRAGCPK
ncbi:MAG TPA: hypothetical protein VF997_01305, partial [Polyangia bacterium]